ncbi:MAG: fdhC [Herminiimonas sp.]|nr:fdhC [Herminiimonas sp.]MDB5854754.1 fdhC [Herminiimonas sp.]
MKPWLTRTLSAPACGLALAVAALSLPFGVAAQATPQAAAGAPTAVTQPAAAPTTVTQPAAANPAAATMPAPAQTTAPAAAGLPSVESADILKQNQAERTRDQPGNMAPTWRIVKEGTKNYSSLPDPEASVLIQPKAQFPGQARATTAGEAWRNYRNGPLTHFGGWLIIIAVLGILAFYFVVGSIRLKAPKSGRLIERFTSLERTVHWTVAITFVTLAVSGLLMLFGKYVVLPVFGHTIFGMLAYLLKNVHNFVGPVFTVSIVVFFILYVKDNFPQRGDLGWLARAGGAIGKTPAHAGRFNAGEKMWFWGGLVFLGLIVSASGFALDLIFPGIENSRSNMQIANVIHVVATVLMASMSLAHIYIGTIGMEGAYDAMRHGYVDDTWAKEHHDLWYDDIVSGKVPRIRTQEGADEIGILPVKAS